MVLASRSTSPAWRAWVMSAHDPGLVSAQNSSRPCSSVNTSAVTALRLLLPAMNLLRPPVPAAGAADSYLGGVHQRRPAARTEVGDHVGQRPQPHPGCTWQPRSTNSGRISLIARLTVERCTPNQQANTSWVVPCRRCTNVTSSRSANTSRYRTPAPTARRRGRAISRPSFRACHTGPISAMRSAITTHGKTC
jgi:hypothetical protein